MTARQTDTNKPSAGKLPLALIVATVMLDAIGIGLIIPVLPDLLLSVLPGQSLSQATIWGGILSSIYALMQFIFSPILGSISDAKGRKPVLVISLIVMIGYYLVMAVAQSIWLLLLGRIVGGITAATNATAGAYMADISSADQKAARFGLIGAGFGMGFVLGPAIGGLLGEWGPRAPFYAAAVLAALNAALSMFILPESLEDKNRRPFSLRRSNPLSALKDIAKFEGLAPLLIIFLVFAVATSVYAAIWPFFTLERFNWSAGMVGISLTIYGVCFAIVQGTLVRPAIKRFGEGKTLIIGFCFEILALFVASLITSGAFMIAWIPIASLGVIGQPALQAIMSKATSDDSQGVLQGVMSSLNSIAMVITPLTMTALFAFFTSTQAPFYFPGAPFMASAILVVISLVLFLRLSAKKQI